MKKSLIGVSLSSSSSSSSSSYLHFKRCQLMYRLSIKQLKLMEFKISISNYNARRNSAIKVNIKNNLVPLIVLVTLMIFVQTIYAQSMGISSGAITPDASSIFEMRTTTKGLLIPRMKTTERDLINSPANGLMIYNTTTKQFNFYNGSSWNILLSYSNSFTSATAGADHSTTSTADTLVGGMTVTPGAGTYVVHFNGQSDIPSTNSTTTFNTATAKTDLDSIYTDIVAVTVTGTHGLTFGSGDTLTAGVYTITGAMSIAGSLTLDGGGNSNALFIMRGSAAFNTSAGTNVTLINGASPENIYWISQNAIGLGASTVIQGTLFSNNGAIAVGAACTITGRLLTKAGALSFGPGTLSLPTDTSSINFRSLITLIMYTASGAIANTGASTYTGDIGTNLGAITAFTAVGCTVNGTIYQAGLTTLVTRIYHKATFSLYQNGVLIPNSARTLINSSIIDLQGIAIVQAGETIEVKWRMDKQISDNGQIDIGNRILTLTEVR